MGKLTSAATAAGAVSSRVDRLARFADGLEQLADRWGREARDPRVAAALSERFGPSAPELLATQDSVAHLLATSFGTPGALPPKLLLRLHDALASLAVLAARKPAPSALNIVPIIDVRSRAQAARLETSARKLLKGLGRLLAAGAIGASVLGALPAAAGDYTQHADGSGGGGGTDLPAHGTNGGGGGAGGSISPTLGGNYDKVGGPAVNVTANGGDGGDGGVGFLVPPLIPVGFGGDGGAGGNGGTVNLTVNGQISTTGDNAVGVQVLSKAGAGGDGGTGVGAVGEGGDGNHGGAGGTANLTSNGTVTTHGAQSSALFAQSAGGAGGDGGFGGGLVGAGGAGSGSGPGGGVGVINNGGLETFGKGSNGVLAQSIGGLSGSGGSAGGIGAFAGGSNSAGIGGGVSVDNHGLITTHGDVAYGILAQSIGGGGGAAGGAGGIAALGGGGSGGGDGGAVDVFNDGTIETGGVASIGMFAQSVGGSGGVGGGAGGLVGIGGAGGASGDGKAVTATNQGVILTHKDLAVGLFAQSVGGGGGNGAGGGGLVGIGGKGGASGKGGDVLVSNSGSIETDGKQAQAVFAQSVGGGGGNGAGAGGLVAIGGDGGAGGAGLGVTVTNDGDLITHGYDSYAVFAQSVGGGGGNGGGAGAQFAVGGKGAGGGAGGNVTVTNHGAINTDLDGSGGVFAQSVGGGGGSGGDSVSLGLFVNLSIGGSGGTASKGGDVTVVNDGAIVTHGDRASAIYAQSVGGGGGDGGFGAGGAIGVYGAVSIGVGGAGGAGGEGGVVHVTADGTLVTTGADSRGVFAQSVGGGGGDGGYSVAAALAVGDVGAASGAISVGGKGAGGGAGGQVIIDHAGAMSIDTTGDRAVGVFAQSVGGGGGNGGWSGAIAVAGSGGVSAAIGVAVGGAADDGGKGGQVTVNTAGDIHTRGVDASAIYAQSIGGGGGTGGFALAGALAGGTAAGSASVGVGGKGGAGSNADEVKVTSVTDIVTEGDRSAGIYAQAVGGGGGSGGWSGAVAGAGGQAAGAVGISIGGSGDHGGKGGVVKVDSTGHIDTTGADAAGVFGQSVGGGGGSGGFSIAAGVAVGQGALGGSVGVGGSGAGGGDGDTVTIDTLGAIHTRGDRSAGIFAQSIGGGGGNGGWSGSLAIAAGQTAGAVGVGVGGSAGTGSDGKIVKVTSTGDITTEGHDAAGVLAQSVGGGGGTGGFSLALGVGAGQTAGAVTVSVGGTGGAGGDAELVKVKSDGVISTKGDRAYGVQAQSIGGGGGSGGFSGSLAVGAGQTGAAVSIGVGGFGGTGGDGGDVEVDVIDLILTLGDDATAVLAQSIGGGGGSGGFSIAAGVGAGQTSGSGSLSIGGFGGAAGDAGDLVTVTSHADISTTGARANGIQAQSIGGGGGAGGWTGSLAVAAGQTSGAVAVGIGGFGAGGGDGKDVTVDSFGQIETHGDDAVGILAQSVGGGGGSGGFSLAAGVSVGQSTGAGSLSIGGGGGVGGDGGVVTVHSRDLIETHNDRAYAIQAQSIGGGGGNGGFSAAVTAALSSGKPVGVGASIGGFGGSGGDAKDVTVVSDVGAVTHGEAAHGLIAQSIGGGGGSGGFSISGALTAGTSTIGVSASIGGFGGSAGDAGDVHVTTDGVTTTEGARAYGVFAQSVGGGGGDGGFAGSLAGGLSSTDNIAIGVAIGGFGGSAGIAGDVYVTNNGKVGTTGDGATAVFAQSVGGGGGSGGMAVSAALGGAKSKNISIALGGSAGGGGEGGDVNVTSTDLVVTEGDDAIAIFAQSVGGGGGAGGAAGALAVSGGESTNLAMNIGGFGGAGSMGGDITVDNSGVVVTHGEQSHGIFAESIGGGGGHGGMAGVDENQWSDYMAGGAGTVSLGSNSNNISVALGGFGGTGDDGGAVKVTNSGVVATTGESQANAIYAQSIGGGGGDAGVATAASGSFGQGKNGTYAIALGGFGGEAGDGGLVQVFNSGSLSTVGGNATGVVAQSVGGGGGGGGDARGFSLSFSKKASGAGTAKATSVNVSIGGQGGAAGDGGEVDVINSGQILTLGGDSHGVFAQSVGGGGGRGGLISTQGEEVVTFLDMANKGEAKGGQIAIGGSGAGGGDGGLVTVGNSGLIWTKGKDAHGVFAQSVGGGGGDGGSGLAGEVSIGGQGGVAGDGGEVRVTNSGTVVTEGALSRGVFAQSVGGGGGTGGATDYDGDDTYSYSKGLSDTMSVVGNLTATKDLVDSFSEPAWGISIGGTGGSAGDGGVVKVDNSGAIYTSGRLSHGIMAQSVGGGGGTGGEGTITAVGQVVFSGVGGTAGDGGDVTVTNSGLIQTSGYGAYGIFAQSVGGGGGVAGDTSLGIASWGDFGPFGGEDYSDYGKLSVNPLDGYGGDGGDVKVTNTGDIILLGEGSVGIFAQSVGGGGGLFGSGLGLSFAGSLGGTGDAGTVTVIQNGNIWTGAKNGVGAFFQSQAGDIDPVSAPTASSLAAPALAAPALAAFTPKDIVATLNGDVRGGSVYGKGILIDGGKNNVITLNGVVSAASNLAIVGTTGNDAIISNKGVIGNIDLGSGTNSFHNTVNSTLLTLDYVKLNGGLLTNDGIVTPGGNGLVQVSRVEGGFKQSATGVFLADLDLGKTGKAGEIDRLDITGSLDLKGKFVLQIADPGHILPGDHTATILNGSGTVTSSGMQLVAPTSSIATFELKTTADDLNLHYVVDFSPAGFNVNRTAVGDHINNIQLAGSSNGFAPVAAELFWEPSQVNLANYYDSFSPETYADQVAVTTFAIAGFTDSLMTCPTAPGQDTATRCVWTKAGGRRLTLDATDQDMAYEERSTGLSGGFEDGNDHWRFGGALSAEDLRTGIPTRTQGDGERYQFGAVVKRIDGPLTAALAFDAGTSSVETNRAVLLPSGLRMAEGKQNQGFKALTARVSYRFGDDKAYAKPIAELSHSRITTHAFSETGAGALNLVAPKQEDRATRLSVKLEVGGEFMQGVTAIRPYARIGASQTLSGRAPLFTAAFQSAPTPSGQFSVAGRLDKTTADAELGVAIVNAKGVSAKINWSGQFGDRVSNQSLAVKFSIPF
uniref:Outer membrane autotransporter barrel domain protein n=1 Tax=Caulobacter sp. (strain K31) TaxID=366602 RepID=B0T2H8_CAUSK